MYMYILTAVYLSKVIVKTADSGSVFSWCFLFFHSYIYTTEKTIFDNMHSSVTVWDTMNLVLAKRV